MKYNNVMSFFKSSSSSWIVLLLLFTISPLYAKDIKIDLSNYFEVKRLSLSVKKDTKILFSMKKMDKNTIVKLWIKKEPLQL